MTINFKAVKIFYREGEHPEHLYARVVWMRAGETPTIADAGRTIHALTGLTYFRIVKIIDNYTEETL